MPDMRRLASQLAAPTTDAQLPHRACAGCSTASAPGKRTRTPARAVGYAADGREYGSGFGGKTRWVSPRRVRRFFDERPLIGLVAGGAFGIALVTFLVVADTSLVARTYERSASSTVVAVVLGAGAALGTVLVFAWSRSRLERFRGKPRLLLGWAGIAWAALFVVAFVWTHPRHRDDESVTPLEVAVVTYCLIIVVVAVCARPGRAVQAVAASSSSLDDQVRVWEVRDKEPYFVAYCDCGWVGTAFDVTDPHAQDNAFQTLAGTARTSRPT